MPPHSSAKKAAAEAQKKAEEQAAAEAKKQASIKLAAVSGGKGFIGKSDGDCGPSDASEDEPNGSQCGLLSQTEHNCD